MSDDSNYAGYSLRSRQAAASAAVELWSAHGPDGDAEVFLGPEMLVRRARALPAWGPFPRMITGSRQGRWFVVVPGRIHQDLEALRDRLTGGTCLAFAWHIAAALAEVHEQGRAHGALHGSHVGLDSRGLLTIRPALASAVRSDPDPDATAQATDCLQLGGLLDLERAEDRSIELLMAGLRRERARLRMQPGRAVRQAIAAILARHPEWVERLKEELGPSWTTDQAPRAPYVPGAAAPAHSPPWSSAATVAAPTGSLAADRQHTGEIEPAVVHLGAVAAGRSVGGTGSPAGAPAPAPAAARLDLKATPASARQSPKPVLTLSLRPPDPSEAQDAPEAPPRAALPAGAAPPTEDAPIAGPPVAQAAESPATAAPEDPSADPPTDATQVAAEDTPDEDATETPDSGESAAPAPVAAAQPEQVGDSEAGDPGPEPDEDEPANDEDSALPADDAPTPGPRPALTTPRPSIAPQAAPEPAPEAAPAARLSPRKLPAAQSEEPAPARVALTPADGAPKWAGAAGVTGNASRESELGSGKWAEDAGNPREPRQLDTNDTPVREIDLEPPGPNWGMLAAGAIVVMILIAWALFASMGTAETDPEAAAAPAATAAPPSRPARVEIRVTGGTGTVTLDGRSYGAAPALVPVPTDTAPHSLCVQAEGQEPVCRDVDAAGLTAGPAYDLDLGG